MSQAPPPPIFANRVQMGKAIVHKGVSFVPVELSEMGMFPKGKTFMLAYRLRDTSLSPTFESPVAHLFCGEREDIRPLIEKVIDTYHQIKGALAS